MTYLVYDKTGDLLDVVELTDKERNVYEKQYKERHLEVPDASYEDINDDLY